MRIVAAVLVVYGGGVCGCLQGQSAAAPAGASWQRLQALPAHTLVHVSSDKMSRLCVLDGVDEAKLTCSAKHVVMASHYTFPRSEIKTVKLTRYLASTAGGVGIGAGVGLAAGVGIAHGGSDRIISNKAVWGITAAIGGIAGGLAGGPTDFLRGPTVYRRP